MIRALNAESRDILGWDAQRGVDYYCPECRESVVFKKGRVVTPHFAHRPDSPCLYGVGESPRHLGMKRQAWDLFARLAPQLEQAVIPGRRADLLIKGRNVIECQASPIGIEEWEARTRDYNRHGCAVLWLWDSRIAFGCSELIATLQERDLEYRVPAVMRGHHREAWGKVYVLDSSGDLAACHLLPALARESEYYTDDGDGPHISYRYPKTLKRLLFSGTPLAPQRKVGSTFGLTLVDLGEPRFWRSREERKERAREALRQGDYAAFLEKA